MNGNLYNNIGICSLAIAFIVQQTEELSLSQIILIMPIISHEELLKYLTRKTTNIQSIEQIIAHKAEYFTNFNDRFYDNLVVTLNSIQLLEEIEIIKLEKGKIISLERIDYEESMGKRAKRISDASILITKIITHKNIGSLYSNLRIKL
ncbi:MAG: three component ABC system middle component [Methylococcaceae bacterium]